MSINRSSKKIDRSRDRFPTPTSSAHTQRNLFVMLDYAIASERGPRIENEDSVGAWALSETRLAFAVADGLGGHLGGKFASHLAIDMYRAALDHSGPLNLANVARTIHLALKAEQEK